MAERGEIAQKIKYVKRGQPVRVERGIMFPDGRFTATLSIDYIVIAHKRDGIILERGSAPTGNPRWRVKFPNGYFPDYTNQDRVVADEDGTGVRVTLPNIPTVARPLNPNKDRRTPNICAPY